MVEHFGGSLAGRWDARPAHPETATHGLNSFKDQAQWGDEAYTLFLLWLDKYPVSERFHLRWKVR